MLKQCISFVSLLFIYTFDERKLKSISEYFGFNNKKQNINQTNYEMSVNELIYTIECDLSANNVINYS
jgi:hypothetical protein